MPMLTWNEFRVQKHREGLSLAATSKAWKAYKAEHQPQGANMAKESRLTGSGRTFEFRIPGQPVIQLSKAVTYDIARGMLQALREGAISRDDGFAQEAAAVLLEAKGEQPEADSIETQFGKMVGEVLKYVLQNEGVTQAEWTNLYPEEMREAGFFDAFGFDSPGGPAVTPGEIAEALGITSADAAAAVGGAIVGGGRAVLGLP